MARKLRYYICLYCKNEFSSSKMYLKYCSKSCALKKRNQDGHVGRKIIPHIVICPNCKLQFHICPSSFKLNKTGIKFCSRHCKSEYMKRGILSYGFKNEGALNENNPSKRIQVNGKRVYEHRYLMEQKIGRKLLSKEHVHHINGNCKDNRIENLMVVSPEEHGKIHKAYLKKN